MCGTALCRLWGRPERVVFRQLLHLLHSGVTQARKPGHVAGSVPCQDAFHALPWQLPAAGCPLPHTPGCCSTHIPTEPRALGIPGAASSSDIPLEMGRLCSGRPEKSQGQRGEVMVAASGVILLPHLRGPLSDSAVVCGCGRAGNTHLLISAAPFLPCPALLWARRGGHSPEPSPGVLSIGGHCWGTPVPAHPKSPQPKARRIPLGFCHAMPPEHQCLLPKPVCSSRWETG